MVFRFLVDTLMRWECFGECGNWSDWYRTAKTKREVLRLSIGELKYYKYGYLRDNKTKQEWVVRLVKSKWVVNRFTPLEIN